MQLNVEKREGGVAPFDTQKIFKAMQAAAVEVLGTQGYGQAERDQLKMLAQDIERQCVARATVQGDPLHIEQVQDIVELNLMRAGHAAIAKAYILYRAKRDEARKTAASSGHTNLSTTEGKVRAVLTSVAAHVNPRLSSNLYIGAPSISDAEIESIVTEVLTNVYDGIRPEELRRALVLAVRTRMEVHPKFSFLASGLLLQEIYGEVLTAIGLDTHVHSPFWVLTSPATGKWDLEHTWEVLKENWTQLIAKQYDLGLLGKKMGNAPFAKALEHIKFERDFAYDYLGIQTLYDRYFLHTEVGGRRLVLETPQLHLARVALGQIKFTRDEDRDAQTFARYYNVYAGFDFMSSTPTLFNSGTTHSQLSSCYLTTVPDDLAGIYDALKDNALLSKYAGGLGNDWTPVRALRSHIKGTNGESQGVVPFLKVVNDTAVAVNQGGKRKGAVCAYLESWHLDIEEFLELRKNTGDERRRTHDMNTANWIPDLFMQRVMDNGEWTLFSPSDVPDLHDLYGNAFNARYREYETMADAGEIKLFRRIPAIQLWRKMLSMLFETGHPWITFKDPCNLRSPQQHVGVVHSSNLCTEITLNTSVDEIAVCNLGSVNAANHVRAAEDGTMVIDHEKLRNTVRVAVEMLDNVIDENFYAVPQAEASNMRHRPIGLGIMGMQDALYRMGYSFSSEQGIAFQDEFTEALCYYAYEASADLASERGSYPSFEGSLWSQGRTPYHTYKELMAYRGSPATAVPRLDWEALARKCSMGMRNSNVVAIAPTATIANITGVSPCIEPTYRNLFVKSNLSGEFTVLNKYLVRDLEKRGLWNKSVVADLKHFDGSILNIDVPADLKELYRTAFETESVVIIESAARRQTWIDQSQSVNIFMAGATGKKLDETYKAAWTKGLKTTYYLRSQGATNAEKSTGTGGELNAVGTSIPMDRVTIATSANAIPAMPEAEGAACYMRPGDPGFDECEACQ